MGGWVCVCVEGGGGRLGKGWKGGGWAESGRVGSVKRTPTAPTATAQVDVRFGWNLEQTYTLHLMGIHVLFWQVGVSRALGAACVCVCVCIYTYMCAAHTPMH